MAAILSIDGVCKRFGAHTALDRVDLTVEQGEFIALLGPSGCGKTTLLRTIAGFLTPDTGRIAIAGQDVSRLPAHRRPLNTVFQNYALFPHLNVLDNVAYGPRRQGLSKRQAHEKARDALAMVGLPDMGARYPREMSGGQQQRVALARAIVNEPKLLLLDEPLSALDLKLRRRMQLELKHLQARLGIAFVFVTHDQEEAMTMADRIVVMHAGRIEQIGQGPEIYRAPATRFVAEFIGEANLLPYQRVPGACAITLTLQGGTLACPQVPDAPSGIAVLRPEDIVLSGVTPGALPEGEAVLPEREAALHGVITDVIRIGSHTLVHVRVDDQTLIARLAGAAPADVVAGGTVRLAFDPARLHLIGGAT